MTRFRARRLGVATALLLATASLPALATENPLRLAGVEHNQYLECLIANAEPGVSPLNTLVKYCGFKPSVPLRDFVKTYQPLTLMDPSVPLATKMEPFRDRFSEYEFGFFGRIDAVTNTAQDAIQADAMYSALEQEAIANLDARTMQARTILGGLAVARHSLVYWTNHEPTADGDNAKWPKWIKCIVTVAADVGGYLLTGALGGDGETSAAVSSAVSEQVGAAIP